MWNSSESFPCSEGCRISRAQFGGFGLQVAGGGAGRVSSTPLPGHGDSTASAPCAGTAARPGCGVRPPAGPGALVCVDVTDAR